MANSFTTNLVLTKPEVGADSNLWGGHLNGDLDILDGIFTSASTTLVSMVIKDDTKFVNATTTSKQVIISASLVSTSTTRTLSAPDATGTIALQSWALPLFRSYLAGLTTSRASATTIGVTAGVCADDTSVAMMTLSSGTINCGTTGADGLDTGALANNTWYHVYAISTAGAVTTARLASTSPTAPTLPGTYTLKRRIGSFKTNGSAQIIDFTQTGDLFQWATATLDINGTSVTGSPTNYTLNIPSGVAVQWQGQGAVAGSSGTGNIYVSFVTPGLTGITSGGGHLAITILSSGIGQTGTFLSILSNTSQQIGTVSFGTGTAVATLSLTTYGWIDRRGRDA